MCFQMRCRWARCKKSIPRNDAEVCDKINWNQCLLTQEHSSTIFGKSIIGSESTAQQAKPRDNVKMHINPPQFMFKIPEIGINPPIVVHITYPSLSFGNWHVSPLKC